MGIEFEEALCGIIGSEKVTDAAAAAAAAISGAAVVADRRGLGVIGE